MKKLLLLLFLSFGFAGSTFALAEPDLDFSADTFCEKSPKVQVRSGLFYLPNQEKPYSGENLCIYLKNGQYFNRGKIKEGLKEGLWTYWFENGELKWTYWLENGELKSKIVYKNNQIIEQGVEVDLRQAEANIVSYAEQQPTVITIDKHGNYYINSLHDTDSADLEEGAKVSPVS